MSFQYLFFWILESSVEGYPAMLCVVCCVCMCVCVTATPSGIGTLPCSVLSSCADPPASTCQPPELLPGWSLVQQRKESPALTQKTLKALGGGAQHGFQNVNTTLES